MDTPYVRLPADWHRFDRIGLIGSLIFPALLALLWLTGFGPGAWRACETAATGPAQIGLAPVPAPVKPPEPAPRPAPALAPPPAPVPPPAPAAAVAPEVPAGLVGFKLPDGTQIAIADEGLESRLLGFLTDKSRGVDKALWFDFDRLQYKTGSSNLTAESKAQLDTLAAILRAYPNVAVKIGGYTDNVGDPEANLKLSAARAEKVASEIVGLGIAADRVEYEGYGDQHPIADNASAEGRAKNRRTAVSVRRK